MPSVFDTLGKVTPYPQLTEAKPPPSREWSFSDLYHADLPKIEGALCGHVFTPASVSMTLGDFGVGKTWFTMSMDGAIALGKPWGHMPTNQRRVLYFSEEMIDSEMQPRIKALFSPREAEEMADMFRFRFRTGLKVENADDCKRMAELIDQAGAKFVTVDATRDIHGCDENSNNEMSIVFRNLRDHIATPTGSHINLIHHNSKPSEFRRGAHRGRGAVVMMDVCADILLVEKAEGGKMVTFEKIRHGRAPDPFSYRFSQDPDDDSKCLFEISQEEGSEGEQLMQVKKLGDLIEKNASMNLEQIKEEMSWGTRSARQYISMAVASGRVENVMPKNVKAVYRIRRSEGQDGLV